MDNLIRFDWAIKKVLRDKANFDILEGLLTALLQEDIKVVNLLESETNQEDDADKFNRVDILVENQKKELIIIEVQVKSEYDFFHRISYGVSKLITEYLQKGKPYGELKKVISISIAYFNLGIGEDYLYHGTTRFIGMNKNDELTLGKNQKKLFETEHVHKIFPEFYLIRVGKFTDEIKESIDEWIYMLKHSNVKPEFQSKHIQKASEKLHVLKLNEKERKAYNRFMDNRSYEASMIWSSKEEGWEKGWEEGEKEGRNEGKLEEARKMLINVLKTKFKEVPQEIYTALDKIQEISIFEDLVQKAVLKNDIKDFHDCLCNDSGICRT